MPYKILVVEDDPVIRQQLQLLLAGSGYQVEAAGDAPAALDQMKTFAPQLVLLDIGLPGASGLELCAQIRGFSQVPIVFVTSSHADLDELNSILLGGDAFLTKPYNPAILLAKIAALLRRAYPAAAEETLCWKDALLHLESGALEYRGRTVELTRNEQKILYYLFRHAGTICARADLVDFLWDNQLYIDDNALSVHVSRIRDKLASIGLTDFIQTKHRQGYKI